MNQKDWVLACNWFFGDWDGALLNRAARPRTIIAECFSALGICVDVSCLRNGQVLLDIAESRKKEFISAIDSILSSGRLKRNDALKFRGRLQFSSTQVFGRVAQATIGGIATHAHHAPGDVVSEDLAFTCSCASVFSN